jgi:light-regulated signal transduction histidine kinase (bacteriophytochrome)
VSPIYEATYSFSLTEILELTRQRLVPAAEKANVKLTIENVASEIELDNLRANLLNLGQNAIEASNKGVVTLEAKQEEENLEFRVRDDGEGIAEQIRERLFPTGPKLQTRWKWRGARHLPRTDPTYRCRGFARVFWFGRFVFPREDRNEKKDQLPTNGQ